MVVLTYFALPFPDSFMRFTLRFIVATLVGFWLGFGLLSPAAAGGRVAAPLSTQLMAGDSTDRLIVKLRNTVEARPDLRIAEIGSRMGERIRHLRAMSGGSQVVMLPSRMSRADAKAVARRLARDPSVAFVEPDLWLRPLLVPNDSYYPQQWNLYEAAGGINMPSAWDITTGASSVVVAVVDTGITNHADLVSRLVAGYDFVTDTTASNDGDGRDADASDPGDYGCGGSNSSWHGTHVAGIIGATSNNATGVTGVNWGSKIQSVRVLGSCGGYTSDIVDGMRWAAGITVAGVPANATPAKVLNLSLGGTDTCSSTFQNAINDVVARGSVVVVAAGNSSADVANATPANCIGVVAVAATVRNGGRASYSNYGSGITIAAPGGGSGGGILSTLNAGTASPGADSYAYYQGTSMATPHVSGVVSLMLSANPSLTPTQVIAKLKASARAFPAGTGSDCSTGVCGAGIVDAAAALTATTPNPPPPTSRVNLALASNGSTASSSSDYSSYYYPASSTINGDRRGLGWSSAGNAGWNDATANGWPDWLQVDFGTARTLAEIDVFTLQDAYTNPQAPTETMTFGQYGITDFEVQYWTGSTWETVPGGSVTGNNKVWRKFTFTPVSTRQIRVLVTSALAGYSRIVELEAYSTLDSAPSAVNVALQSNGGRASASSEYSAYYYPASGANNGERRGLGWASGPDAGWNDGTANNWPDSLRIDFSGSSTITEIDVFTLQDNYATPQEPTDTLTFGQYGITSFEVQYMNGNTWTTVPGGSVTGNDKVWRKFTFPAITTGSIRIFVTGGLAGFSRITEVEAYGTAATTAASTNVALQGNGGTAVASSEYSSYYYPAGAAINGDRRGIGWATLGGAGWNDGTQNSWPDTLQINFNAVKTIGEIDVFTLQDAYTTPQEPTATMTFSQYGITDFDVQYWNGTAWTTVPGGSVSGNNLVWRRFTFPAVSAGGIRIVVRGALAGYARITEVEAYTSP